MCKGCHVDTVLCIGVVVTLESIYFGFCYLLYWSINPYTFVIINLNIRN